MAACVASCLKDERVPGKTILIVEDHRDRSTPVALAPRGLGFRLTLTLGPTLCAALAHNTFDTLPR